jgi:hypothetical protein
LFIAELAPSYKEFPSNLDVFLKCVVSVNHRLENHIENFQPDKVICFHRDYKEVEKSLSKKFYGKEGGFISEKIKLFDHYSNSFKFDYNYSYDRMVARDLMGVEDLLKKEYFLFQRSLSDIVDFNKQIEWCDKYALVKWSLGNIHTDKPGNSHQQFKYLNGVNVTHFGKKVLL